MTEAEQADFVAYTAANPEAGDLIVGSGGVRKVRFAGKAEAKSGGYRVATIFVTGRGVYLLWVLSKGSAANFTDAQIKAFATLVKEIKAGRG